MVKKILFIIGIITLLIIAFFSGVYIERKVNLSTNETISLNDLGYNMDSIKHNIAAKGDVNAYKIFMIQIMNDENDKDIVLPYALIMSNKYNYAPANVDIFLAISDFFKQYASIEEMDNETKKIALYYLEKGAILSDFNALNQLSQLYNEGKLVPKDSSKAKELELQAEKVADYKIVD